MHTKTLWLAALAAAAVGSTTLDARAGKDLELKELPPKVKDAVLRETKGGQIKEIEEEKSGGSTFYQVEYTKDGKDWEIDLDREGKLLERRADD